MANRRDFLKSGIAGLSAAALSQTAVAQSGKSDKMIGIQVGAVSFVDEGIEQVLDIFQQRAGINTLFLAVFTYGRGIAGTPGSRPASARPRQAGIRSRFPRRQLRHGAPAVLQRHG